MELSQHKYDFKNLVISVLIWELAFWLLYFSLFYYMTEEVEAFQFENPEWLWVLLIVPLLVLGFFSIIQWKNAKLSMLADERLLRYLTSPVSNIKSFMKYFLFRNGIVFLILAMANPQYGQGKNKAVADGIEIMIALDISNSMRALDLDSKMDRLQVAKLSVERLLNNLHGDKVGIVIFAGDAFVQVPLTNDYRAAKLFLYSVRPEMMTNQGTDIGLAIDKCMKSFDMENGVNKAIIVISDGEDHEGNPESVAKGAFEHNVIVSTVGMGTNNETPIPNFVDGKVEGYKKDDEGNTVLTKLNATMLQAVAAAGGGAYVQAEGTYVNLEGLLETVREIEKTEMESVLYVDYEDQYQWFLGIGLIFLFIEFFLTEKRSGIVHKLQEYNG
ncbi:MAG: VWA domain-containing protein [Bacteroidetes bacterium]|nr:VWA domain-containing protein [Bacteroidota bacterium]